jgi:methyl-accepting chemotaxis protein
MRIDRRLATALAIGIVPVVIGAFLVSQDLGVIERARTEFDGVGYASLVLPELASLAKDKTVPAAADPRLAAAAEANDGKLGTGAISAAYRELKADLATGAFPAAARQAAATLIARIHVATGVLADTDRDAGVMARVPQAANAAPLSPALLDASRYAPVVVPAAVDRLTEVLAQFRAATATDGKPQGPVLTAYVAAAAAFADRVEAGIAALARPELRDGYDWAGLDDAHRAYQDAALALGQSSAATLRDTLQERIESARSRIWLTTTLAALALTIGVAALVAALSARRLRRLSAAMRHLAEGEFATEIPFAGLRNEFGAMAQSLAAFRDHAVRLEETATSGRAALAEHRDERTRTMQELQRCFGHVVDGALEGDFTRRIEVRFVDDELNRLAGSVNALVARIDEIVAATGTALAALADADLTHRMVTSHGGALGQLGRDTNQMAERLSEMVIALQQGAQARKLATGEILSGANHLSEAPPARRRPSRKPPPP